MIQLTLTLKRLPHRLSKCQSQSTTVLFRSTVVHLISPSWSCSSHYEMTPGFRPFKVFYFTNCHTFVVCITLKRWMPWTSKFLHFSHRVIVVSKYVVTILVSTDFAWWLAHRVVMVILHIWLYCLSCGCIFFSHNSRHSSIVDGLKNYFVQELVFDLLSGLSRKYVYSPVYIL